jgi:hypothetical protein
MTLIWIVKIVIKKFKITNQLWMIKFFSFKYDEVIVKILSTENIKHKMAKLNYFYETNIINLKI